MRRDQITTLNYYFILLNTRERVFPLILFLAVSVKVKKVLYHVTVEFWITMQFVVSKRLPFHWMANQWVLSLGRNILLHASLNLTMMIMSELYFAWKKQRYPRYLNAEFLPLSVCIYSMHTFYQKPLKFLLTNWLSQDPDFTRTRSPKGKHILNLSWWYNHASLMNIHQLIPETFRF